MSPAAGEGDSFDSEMSFVLTTRSVGLLVASALAVGWFGATLTQEPPPAQSVRSTGPRALGTAPVPRAEHLRERLKEPPLPSRGRNPFVFGSSRPRTAPSFRGRDEAPVAPPMAAAPYEPPLPVFKLSGIASATEGDTTVLTAIMNDNGAMVFAKAGDKLSNGYSVVRVEEASVTLVDATGVTQTIRLP
jgi:hypothetical protein